MNVILLLYFKKFSFTLMSELKHTDVIVKTGFPEVSQIQMFTL